MSPSNCLKCGYPRKEKALECPNCGVIYHKAEAALQKIEQQKGTSSSAASGKTSHNSSEAVFPCPHCNHPVPKKSKVCHKCGYDRLCYGCERLVPKNETICPYCGFKIITAKQYRNVMIVMCGVILYFFLSFLFMFNRPYINEWNAEYDVTFAYLGIPFTLLSL